MGIGTYELIHGYPNGGTRYVEDVSLIKMSERTQGTETSHYLQEEKIIMIPRVVVSEIGTAQTVVVTAMTGLKEHDNRRATYKNNLGRLTAEGESPVSDMFVIG